MGADADDRLGERVARRVEPLLWALAAAFAFFTALTVVVRPPEALLPLVALDVSGTLVMAGAALFAGARGVSARRANTVAGLALLVAVVASLVAIELLHLPTQTTNLMLLELLAAMVLLSAAWTAIVLSTATAGWMLVAWSEGFGEPWLVAGASLVVTTIMSIMLQVVRLRDARDADAALAADRETRTRLERAYTTEREHVRALASANEGLEAFAYVISHDLKEPIRAMSFYLQEARAAADGPEREDLLERAIASHQDLTKLVQGLLEWSRATTTPLDPIEVDVEALLRDASTRAQFERVLLERRGKLLVENGLPPVLGTPALVRQVLGNLILNAIRHNPNENAQVRVYAAPDAPRGMVDLIVEDNGPGFPERMLRAGIEAAPRTLRSGFGLEIVHRAAGRMGGALHLENSEKGGARVHVVLPHARASKRALDKRVRELV